MRKIPLVAVLLILAATAYYAWSQRSARIEAETARTEAERTLGLDAARVLSAHFENAAALKVGTLRGEIVVRAEDKGLLGVVPTEQTTRIPSTVDYFVDLSRMEQGAYRYSPRSRTLTIDVPDVSVAPPNVDERRSRTTQRGVFISRRAALALAGKVSAYATQKSAEEARKRENLDKARANARNAIASMTTGPLRAAGLGDVKVAVSFPWEPKATADERWDVSRPVEDVLRERARTTPATTPSS